VRTQLIVGVGSYAMPRAFACAGLWGGIVGVPVAALWCVYTMHLLLLCKEEAAIHCNGTTDKISLHVIGAYFFGAKMSVVTNAVAIFASLGACAGYIDFLSPLVASFVGGDTSAQTADHATIVWAVAPLFILLSWIRSFKSLAWTSLVRPRSPVLLVPGGAARHRAPAPPTHAAPDAADAALTL
jgi:amino acid permease